MKKLRITVNGVTYEVDVEVLHDDAATEAAPVFGAPIPGALPPVAPPPPAPVPVPVAAPKAASPNAGGKTLTSPLPGVVKAVKAKEGESVKTNTPLVVLEAMKMETNISSPFDGVIKEIKVTPGQNVQQGEVLVVFG